MHLARDPQQARHGQRGNGDDDQLHRRLEADERRDQADEEVDTEIADRRPAECIILLQPGRMAAVQLDAEAPHVPEQVNQRRNGRIEQRHGR